MITNISSIRNVFSIWCVVAAVAVVPLFANTLPVTVDVALGPVVDAFGAVVTFISTPLARVDSFPTSTAI
jgi:uncharacterized membrane protein